MGNNVILRLLSGKRTFESLDMCGIIWQIIFIVLNIHTSSWVLQLGIIFPLCSTLVCGNTGKKWSYDEYFRDCIYLYLPVAQERVKQDWMSSGAHFIWAMQPCCDSAADLTARTDCQSRPVSHMCLPKIISQWFSVID